MHPERFVRRTLAYWVLGIILLLPLVNFFLGIHPPRFTTDDDPARYGLEFEEVSFQTSDGLTLRGWLIPSSSLPSESSSEHAVAEKSRATIIVGHGYPFDKANILRHALFLHPRFNLLLFDFRYFGDSEGNYTTAGVLETRDVYAAVEYLKRRNDVDAERIGALGFSMSASAFILARHPAIKAIVADSPYASLEKVIARQFFFLPGPTKWPMIVLTKIYAKIFLGVNLSDGAPGEAVKDLSCPLFLIHGEADSQIPVEHSHTIFRHANPETTELWIVPGADHGFAHALEGRQYELKILRFFERYV